MARSAVRLLNRVGKITVAVENFKQLTEDIGALAFKYKEKDQEEQLYVGTFNVPNLAVMDMLLMDRAGKPVEVVIDKDNSSEAHADDEDRHPEILEASEIESA